MGQSPRQSCRETFDRFCDVSRQYTDHMYSCYILPPPIFQSGKIIVGIIIVGKFQSPKVRAYIRPKLQSQFLQTFGEYRQVSQLFCMKMQTPQLDCCLQSPQITVLVILTFKCYVESFNVCLSVTKIVDKFPAAIYGKIKTGQYSLAFLIVSKNYGLPNLQSKFHF